ncbi:MAG TPA: hypothetical protein VJP78_06665, partial [Thermoleophilia bacterium]|nr:hypothetical protein [Thermoleophilia bacterium]
AQRFILRAVSCCAAEVSGPEPHPDHAPPRSASSRRAHVQLGDREPSEVPGPSIRPKRITSSHARLPRLLRVVPAICSTRLQQDTY